MTTMQFSLFVDEPMVAVTPRGKRAANTLAAAKASAASQQTTPQQPTANGRHAAQTLTKAQRSTTQTRSTALARTSNTPQRPVPLAPAAQLAVNRIAPLQPAIRIALLELLAVVALHEAQAQRALLPAEVYPYTVQLNAELLASSIQTILNSPVMQQAIALNALLAQVPDEPIPEPTAEYLAYVEQEAQRSTQAAQPVTHASSPATSQQPADQFGASGSDLTWPEHFPTYGKPFKDGKSQPIVPIVLLVGSRQAPYTLPKLAIGCVQYATQVQLRVKFYDAAGTERSITQDGCYCVPTAEHLRRIVALYSTFQAALTQLAAELTDIGTYTQRLREACDIDDPKTQPTAAQLTKLAKKNHGLERLCDHVISAPEPTRRSFTAFNEPFRVPDVSRGPIFRHTPLCYQKYQGGSSISQSDTFPCVDEETWTAVQAAVDAVVKAQKEWLALLAELGSYKVATSEQRYTPVVNTKPKTSAPAATIMLFGDDEPVPDAEQADEPVPDAAKQVDQPAVPSSFDFEELVVTADEA
jgi:hypothetical protein